MEIVGVRVEMPSSSPIALLREVGGNQRLLTIFTAAPEATSIAFALEESRTPRPLTPDRPPTSIEHPQRSLQRINATVLP